MRTGLRLRDLKPKRGQIENDESSVCVDGGPEGSRTPKPIESLFLSRPDRLGYLLMASGLIIGTINPLGVQNHLRGPSGGLEMICRYTPTAGFLACCREANVVSLTTFAAIVITY